MKGFIVCLVALVCCLVGLGCGAELQACPPVAVSAFGVQSVSAVPFGVSTFSAAPVCNLAVQAQSVVVPQAVHVQQFVPLVSTQAVVVQQNVVAVRAARAVNQRSVVVQRSRTSSGGVLGLGLLR